MTRTRTRSILLLLLIAGAAPMGCQKNLFPIDEPRSQYDRFDAVRDRRPPDRVENALAEKKINLRGRLLNTE